MRTKRPEEGEERMSTKTVLGCALILAALEARTVLAADRVQPTPAPGPYPVATTAEELSAPTSTASPGVSYPSPSAYITYRAPGCCGHVGGEGPIQCELYVRSGVAIPEGGGFLNDAVGTGWFEQLGGRVLFFNTAETQATTVDLSLAYIYNSASGGKTFPVEGFPSTVRDLHRTD